MAFYYIYVFHIGCIVFAFNLYLVIELRATGQEAPFYCVHQIRCLKAGVLSIIFHSAVLEKSIRGLWLLLSFVLQQLRTFPVALPVQLPL